jgi:chromosome segregation ATPase
MKTRKTIPLYLALLAVILIAAAATILIFVQFDQKKKFVAATELSKAEQESYVMSVFDRIESNLAKIREKESMIRKGFTTSDNSSALGPEERIQHEIEFIEYLIEENNMLIANPNQQVRDQDSRLQNYESAVKDLKSRINEYQVYLDKLTAEKQALQEYLDETTADRNRLSAKVDTLNNEIAQTTKDLTEWINKTIEKEDELNTAYYAIGPFKVLRDKEDSELALSR